jgi:hypothetical protein
MDLYTKVILTMIAVALSALAIENASGRAMADNGLTKVAICDLHRPDVCAEVDGGGAYKTWLSVSN